MSARRRGGRRHDRRGGPARPGRDVARVPAVPVPAVPVSVGTEGELHRSGYQVRRFDPGRAVKPYTCPCGNAVRVGEGHVVAWPDGEPGERRHWHRHCWRLEVRRTDRWR